MKMLKVISNSEGERCIKNIVNDVLVKKFVCNFCSISFTTFCPIYNLMLSMLAILKTFYDRC